MSESKSEAELFWHIATGLDETAHKNYMRGLEAQREADATRYTGFMSPVFDRYEGEMKDHMRKIDAKREEWQSRTPPVMPKMPDIHELEGYEGLYWMGSAEVYAYRDEMIAWADERVRLAKD